jgi:aspartate/methionine/tyrosine aminotransferase
MGVLQSAHHRREESMPKRVRTAERMSRLGTESAFEMFDRARALEAAGRDVIHLEIGEPDFDTPAHIVDAAIQALHDGHTHYTPAAGMPVLREAVAAYTRRTRAIEVTADRVVVTPGAKPIVFFALLALVGEGDEVIYPDPCFPIFPSMIRFAGGRPVPIPLSLEGGFSFGAAELAERLTSRTRLLILNSPANPTGAVHSPEQLAAIARLAQEHDLVVLSDEIYSRIVYDEPFHSIASVPGMAERTIVLDGFSKTYAMTGWRLGWGVLPAWLVEPVTRLMINSNSCTAAFSQVAGAAALNGSQAPVDAMVAAFRERRDLVVAGLNRVPGFDCLAPQGAFYAFPRISATGLRSRALADYLLNEAGVAVLAGSTFGDSGEGYLRLSYASSLERLASALERIDAAVRRL